MNFFPRLSFLARQYLATPATSAAVERRVFSSAGRTISDLRSSLSSQTVSDMLFVHYNCWLLNNNTNLWL